MKKYKNIFIVLVYKNYDDFLDFYNSLSNKVDDFKVVIVNSFFDKQSLELGGKIAAEKDCDFISIDNKGYGYGNNAGINYALDKFEFEFLIVSNPDIEVLEWDNIHISKEKITGPSIVNKANKQQNPHYFKKNKYSFYIMKKYADTEKERYLYLYLFLNKFLRNINRLEYKIKSKNEVFAVHGSFFIVPYKILDEINPIFDEKIFLYTEENHLAEVAKRNQKKLVFNKHIKVFHKEDGSSNNVNTKKNTLESLKIYFKNWEL